MTLTYRKGYSIKEVKATEEMLKPFTRRELRDLAQCLKLPIGKNKEKTIQNLIQYGITVFISLD